MKTLLTIRHAKAETSLILNDFERSLNERGKKDAPEIARRLVSREIKIDAFVSSPAKRAKKTAEFFCNEYNFPIEHIVFISALYHASAENFFEVVSQLDDQANTVALFAHNPGITHFVNQLTKTKQIGNMPTCAVFAVEAHVKEWSSFSKAEKNFLFFESPKNCF